MRIAILSSLVLLGCITEGPEEEVDAVGGGGKGDSTAGWSIGAKMKTPRQDFAAATGPDGRIYAFGGGGLRVDDPVLSSVEIYDPKTNKWTAGADMPTGRTGHVAVALAGRIYVIGGFNYRKTHFGLALVEVYDPTTDSWSAAAEMGDARYHFGATAGADGRIYAMGGSRSRTAEVYDPATDVWSVLPDMASQREEMSAAAGPDGRIYAIGGYTAVYDPDLPDLERYLDSVEVYDPATNKWSAGASTPSRHAGHTTTLGLDGRMWVIGGYNGEAGTKVVETYNPETNKWSPAPSLPRARDGMASATGLDGAIYALGGYLGSATYNQPFSSEIDIYRP